MIPTDRHNMNIALHIPEPVFWVVGTLTFIIMAKLAMEFLYPGN